MPIQGENNAMELNQSQSSSMGVIVEELLEQSYYRFLYKGKDQVSRQPVLIHHWPTALIKTIEEQGRFSQDIFNFQQLAHPHILPILKVRIHERGVSLISQYPLQGSLQERLNQQPLKPLPLHEAYTIIKQVGQALHHAHQNKIFHGALTPWAVFFHNAGHAVVTSFHFQSIIAALPNYQPIQSQRLPRIWYMAPEQFDGVINEKTDQYALGCLAYALLTGRVPQPGYTHKTLVRKHRSEAPKTPGIYNDQVPDYIEDAILKSLAKQPEQRHASVQDFLQALEAPQPARFAAQMRQQRPLATAALGNFQTTVARGFYSLPPMRTLSQNLSAGHYSRNPLHTILAKGPLGNKAQKTSLATTFSRNPFLGVAVLIVVVVLVAVIVSAAALAGQANRTPAAKPPAPTGIVHRPPAPTAPPSTHQPAPTPVPPAPTPSPAPGGNSCHVDYQLTNQGTLSNGSSGGFTANISITNTSSSAIHGWQLVFSYEQSQQIVGSINAHSVQQGKQITLTNISNNATIAAGQSLTVTVVGMWNGSNPSPTAFTLNNTICQ
jgi:serine/threonine protein kinase